MKQLKLILAGIVFGVAATLGTIQVKSLIHKTDYKVGDCLRVLGDASIWKVTYVVDNTVEAETQLAFGPTRQVFYNVGSATSTEDMPPGFVRGVLINAKCEVKQ